MVSTFVKYSAIQNCLLFEVTLYPGHMEGGNSTFSPPTEPGNEADPGKNVDSSLFSIRYLNWTKMSVKSRGMPVA